MVPIIGGNKNSNVSPTTSVQSPVKDLSVDIKRGKDGATRDPSSVIQNAAQELSVLKDVSSVNVANRAPTNTATAVKTKPTTTSTDLDKRKRDSIARATENQKKRLEKEKQLQKQEAEKQKAEQEKISIGELEEKVEDKTLKVQQDQEQERKDRDDAPRAGSLIVESGLTAGSTVNNKNTLDFGVIAGEASAAMQNRNSSGSVQDNNQDLQDYDNTPDYEGSGIRTEDELVYADESNSSPTIQYKVVGATQPTVDISPEQAVEIQGRQLDDRAGFTRQTLRELQTAVRLVQSLLIVYASYNRLRRLVDLNMESFLRSIDERLNSLLAQQSLYADDEEELGYEYSNESEFYEDELTAEEDLESNQEEINSDYDEERDTIERENSNLKQAELTEEELSKQSIVS
jgi:hypothetical protein